MQKEPKLMEKERKKSNFLNNNQEEFESKTNIIVNENKSNEPQRPIRKLKSKKVTVNVSSTQYDVVINVMKSIFNFHVTTNNNLDFDLLWTDNAVTQEIVSKLKSYQKINHFPGMSCLSRKNLLGKNLMKMRSVFPREYKFFPETWLLPAENAEFKNQFSDQCKRTYILKPEALSQGKGIFITKKYIRLHPFDHYVAQRYICKPLLIEGLKFDLRIYALIYGCNPLRIFIYKDGLARLATEKYERPLKTNLGNLFMHLTNYAINKNSDKFVYNKNENQADIGHKRSLSFIWKYIDEQGGDSILVFDQIKKIIIKTMCSVQPSLAHAYRTCQPNDRDNNKCFEILGFDILIDYKFKPWLLEVNHSPSFTTDTPFDLKIKSNLIENVVNIIGLSSKNRDKSSSNNINSRLSWQVQNNFLEKSEKAGNIEVNTKKVVSNLYINKDLLGNFEQIYPDEDNDYEIYIRAASIEYNNKPSKMIKSIKIQKEISSRECNIPKSKNHSVHLNINNNTGTNQSNLKLSNTRKVNSNNSYMVKFWKMNHDQERKVINSWARNAGYDPNKAKNLLSNSFQIENKTVHHIIPEEFEQKEDESIKTDYNSDTKNNASFLPEINLESSYLSIIKRDRDSNESETLNKSHAIDKYENNLVKSALNKSNNSVGRIKEAVKINKSEVNNTMNREKYSNLTACKVKPKRIEVIPKKFNIDKDNS